METSLYSLHEWHLYVDKGEAKTNTKSSSLFTLQEIIILFESTAPYIQVKIPDVTSFRPPASTKPLADDQHPGARS